MRTRGFTIVELLIVITVMAILIPITMFSLNGLNKTGRDRERESDVASIARQLEIVYADQLIDNSTPSYPGTTDRSALATRNALFSGGSMDIIKAPGGSTFSLVAALNAVETTAGIVPKPSGTAYIYQPLKYDSGSSAYVLCAEKCEKFNLYYLNESDNKVIMVKSRRQQ